MVLGTTLLFQEVATLENVYWMDSLQRLLQTPIPSLLDGPLNLARGYNTYTGAIQDLRLYKGVAKYTSNFTPPRAILG